ncbi:MAG: 1,4-dihydroxy-2-naphthoate polyprenyltransferase [Planctomycetes bacterium]|nr:1,4-dihydroxy-2-naphthoate polyprenyltransferase [Planctomycetota bacterium]
MTTKSKLKIWFETCRPKTLTASVAPVLIGAAMAFNDGSIDPLVLALTFAAALLIQIGTNLANDYYDFKKGADTETRIGPTRATQAGLVTPSQMKFAFILTFALAAAAGLYLVYKGGIPILTIGLVSIICGVLYTAGPIPLAYYGLGDIFVLVFFGPVAVGGTYYLQTRTINPYVLIAGLAPGLFSVAILTVNNFRDIETDKAANKKTLAVRFGPKFAIAEYITAVIAACLIPAAIFILTWSNKWSLMSLHALLIAILPIKTILSKPTPETLNAMLAKTGFLLIFYSVLFSVGWVI